MIVNCDSWSLGKPVIVVNSQKGFINCSKVDFKILESKEKLSWLLYSYSSCRSRTVVMDEYSWKAKALMACLLHILLCIILMGYLLPYEGQYFGIS